MISFNEVLVAIGLCLLLVFILRGGIFSRKDTRNYPPSFPCLPIVGSLPFVKDFKAIPQYFLQKSYELGPVFTLKFGSRRVLVLNTRKAIEDALVKHASSFSGREGFYTEKYHFNINQKGIGYMDYGEEFKRYQRLTISIMKEFGCGSKSILETRILDEVTEMKDYFLKLNGAPFDPKEIMILSASNVPINILLGRRTKYVDGMNETCRQMELFISRLNPALDLFPILRFIPPHSTKLKEMKGIVRDLLRAIENEIDESLKDGAADSFVRRYVDREGPGYDRQQLVFTLRDLIGASLDTTSATLLWAFVFLANNHVTMQKVQREIDAAVSRDSLPKVEHEKLMPFTQATILEILRHRPVVPLCVPHLTQLDTQVQDYFVPADTVVLPNLVAAHMNRSEWEEPDVFRPERFLDENNKVINQNHVIAFSLGRRSCLGESVARSELFLFITGILQRFSIRPPDGVQSISEKIVSGVVLTPEPFEIRLIARNE